MTQQETEPENLGTQFPACTHHYANVGKMACSQGERSTWNRRPLALIPPPPRGFQPILHYLIDRQEIPKTTYKVIDRDSSRDAVTFDISLLIIGSLAFFFFVNTPRSLERE